MSLNENIMKMYYTFKGKWNIYENSMNGGPQCYKYAMTYHCENALNFFHCVFTALWKKFHYFVIGFSFGVSNTFQGIIHFHSCFIGWHQWNFTFHDLFTDKISSSHFTCYQFPLEFIASITDYKQHVLLLKMNVCLV